MDEITELRLRVASLEGALIDVEKDERDFRRALEDRLRALHAELREQTDRLTDALVTIENLRRYKADAL